jgi:hypothetical protein
MDMDASVLIVASCNLQVVAIIIPQPSTTVKEELDNDIQHSLEA